VTERRQAETDLREAEERNRALAEEQAALRRVATLVARGLPPTEIVAAVAEEIGRLVSRRDENPSLRGRRNRNRDRGVERVR
jgi:pilus assembly protein TadC